MVAAVNGIPPLPPGFTLDDAGGAGHPPLPPGFTLDAQSADTGPAADTVASDALAKTIPIPADVQKNAAINALSADNLPSQTPGNIARTAATVIPNAMLSAGAWVAGIPGNIESIGRWGLNKLGVPVSPQNSIMNTSDIENRIAGPATSREAQAGRFIGGALSPILAAKGIPAALKLAGAVAKPLITNTLGVTTGAGGKAIEGAYDAGKAGGTAGQAFLDNMRGNVPISDVVDSAKDAVAQLGRERSAAYRAGIGASIAGDPAILDMQPVEDAVSKSLDVGKFKGVTLSQSAQKVRDAVMGVLTDWKTLDPAEYHTAEGFDALKQKIADLAYEGNLADATKPGSPGAKVLGGVYNAIKGQIVQQAPEYAQVMKDYSQATDELRGIQSALSLNPKANVDTSLRKLQSIMRNNVNTNYGARTQMAGRLVDAGANDLIPSLAGQALNSPTPRGIATVGDIGAIGGAAMAGHPMALLGLPATSPRLVGEAAYGLGSLARGAKSVVSNANQVAPALGNVMSIPAIASNPIVRALLLQQMLSAPVAQSTP